MSRPRKRWTSDSGELQLGLFDAPEADAQVVLVCNPSLAPDPTPEPLPGQRSFLVEARPTSPAIDPVDRIVLDALQADDGSLTRWDMRRASGLSGDDLRAAIVHELFAVATAPRSGPNYLIGGAPGLDPYLLARLPDRPVQLDLFALAVRARRLMRVPSRDPIDPSSPVTAIRARSTGVILYAVEAPDLASAVALMEPGDVGDPRPTTDLVPAGKVPRYVEIRRLPPTGAAP